MEAFRFLSSVPKFLANFPAICPKCREVFIFKKLEFHPSYPSAFSEIMKAEGYEG